MNSNLVAYAAGSLDEPARAEFERLLKSDAELQRQLAIVRRRLAPLQAVDPHVPPADLVTKTLAFVAERACATAAATTVSRAAPGRPWWRRIDLVVAASILVAVVGLSLPAIFSLRVTGAETQCKNNLRELWNGLSAYETQRRSLPDVASAPRPAAGMVIPMLRDAGVLSPTFTACPGVAEPAMCANLSVNDLAQLPGREFDQVAATLLPGYAYSLGYRDDAGHLHGPISRGPDVPAARIALLADAPAVPVGLSGNSPNHAGRGQNVLFTDGHVDFKTLRTAGLPGDDIYLNQANQVAAGLGLRDVVLGNGEAAP